MSDKGASPKRSPTSPRSEKSRSGRVTPEGTGLHDVEHWAALAQDIDDNDDADSSLGTDDESSTASMTSSILNYRTIKGRTYHSERGNAEYWYSSSLPNGKRF
ncbi:hypothetical protein ACHAPJ_011938 [Fusarium lateritium]